MSVAVPNYLSVSNTLARHVVREGELDSEVLRSDQRQGPMKKRPLVAEDLSSCRMIVYWPFVKVTF